MDLSYSSRQAANSAQIREQIRRSGYTLGRQKLWSSEENELFRSLFPDYAAITKALPHRTYFACRAQARRLGIVVTRPPFTARECSLIRKLYPSSNKEELMAVIPGRTWNQIKSLANRQEVYRRIKPYKTTGVIVIDQIRTRCRELNYSMPDLDKLIRGRGYFAQANWSKGHINRRNIGRAVKALFGELRADWK